MLVAVIRLLQHNRLPPAKAKVSRCEPRDDRGAQPAVVRHEDEHDEVGEDHLDAVEQRLNEVKLGPDVRLDPLHPSLYFGAHATVTRGLLEERRRKKCFCSVKQGMCTGLLL
jgi:hypothetical protein